MERSLDNLKQIADIKITGIFKKKMVQQIVLTLKMRNKRNNVYVQRDNIDRR